MFLLFAGQKSTLTCKSTGDHIQTGNSNFEFVWRIFTETGANNKILYSASAVETCMKLMFHMNWDCQGGFDSAVWQFLKLHLCWTGFYCNVPAVYALYQFKSKKVLRWVWAVRHLSSGLLWFIAKFKSNIRATKVITCMLREGSQWEIYRSAILCIALKKILKVY